MIQQHAIVSPFLMHLLHPMPPMLVCIYSKPETTAALKSHYHNHRKFKVTGTCLAAPLGAWASYCRDTLFVFIFFGTAYFSTSFLNHSSLLHTYIAHVYSNSQFVHSALTLLVNHSQVTALLEKNPL